MKKKIYKKLLIILALLYIAYVLINQQKVINQYSKQSTEIASKIKQQQEYNEELNKQKQNVDSTEFIEQMAREKLDMYYPSEKVYIDSGM